MLISGKYQVESQIGQGSMGVVYKVRHTALDTILALKVLPSQLTENEDLVKRFYREARVMARLNHPNIARVIDVQRDDALKFHYFVMEYVQGKTVKQYAREQGRLSLPAIVDVGRQVARALDYAHNFSPPVIHRDIKPTNIMVELATRRIVVMDFGIAKELDETEMTRAGTILGTLKYCPPEQMRHEHLDGSADIYALGMVLYELLRGSHPFEGMRESEVMRTVLDAAEYTLIFAPATPPEFVALITKALTKNVEQRYRRMGEMLRDLERCWSVLDADQATVVTGRSEGETGDGRSDDDLTRLEEQIHKLEEERQRRRVLQAQSKAQTARDAAGKESAAEFAAEVFERASEVEGQAISHYREKRYPEAQTAYAEAQKLFEEAQTQAAAARIVHSAGRLREEVAAARRDADLYGASERAVPSYGRALALQARADDLWEHKSFREAYEAYGEARSLFESAHDLAYQALLEEDTKTFLGQIRAAREAAISAQAEELASEDFWEAVRNERRGDTALAQSEFTQAQELYRRALGQYQAAEKSAVTARRRQQALAAQTEAREAQQRAEDAGATETLEEFLEAAELRTRAEKSWLMETYEEAAEHYRLAVAAFEKAGAAAKALQKNANDAELAVRIEHLAAEWAEARPAMAAFPDRFADITQQLEMTECLAGEGRLDAARDSYQSVLEAITRVRGETARQDAAREAERLRSALQQLRESLGPAIADGSTCRKAAELAAAAEQAWTDKAYELAAERFRTALAAYNEAQYQQTQTTQREPAAAALTQAKAALAAADRADAQAGAEVLYTKGCAALTEGEHAFRQQQWSDAERQLAAAVGHLDNAAREAQRAKRLKSLNTAQKTALKARAKAHSSGAGQGLQKAYAGAESLLKTAEQCLSSEAHEEAQRLFTEAGAAFEKLAAEWQVQQREQALAKKALAERAAADSSGGDEASKRETNRAKKAFVGAEQLFTSGRYAEAEKQFEVAARLFNKATPATPAPAPASTTSRPPTDTRDAWPWPFLVTAGLLAGGIAGVTVYQWHAPAPTDVNQARVVPGAESAAPFSVQPERNAVVRVKEGLSQRFSVTATGTGGENLDYKWYLDGSLVNEAGANWVYTPDFDSAGAQPKEVKLVISRSGKALSTSSWKVAVENVNRGPRIDSLTPAGEQVELAPGEDANFAVTGSDPDKEDELNYRWFADDQPAATGREWHYTLPDGSDAHQVTVELSDRAGLTVRNSWRVQAVSRPLQKGVGNLEILSSPADSRIELEVGKPLLFSVKPRSGSAESWTAQWYLGGVKAGTGVQWTYTPGDLDVGTREIRVAVADSSRRSISRSWQIRVVARAAPGAGQVQAAESTPPRSDESGVRPVILSARPEQHTVSGVVGEALDFAVEASAGRPGERRDPDLRYQWRVDGGAVQTTSEGSFQLQAASVGRRQLAVVVVGRSGLKSKTRSWLVDVQDRRP